MFARARILIARHEAAQRQRTLAEAAKTRLQKLTEALRIAAEREREARQALDAIIAACSAVDGEDADRRIAASRERARQEALRDAAAAGLAQHGDGLPLAELQADADSVTADQAATERTQTQHALAEARDASEAAAGKVRDLQQTMEHAAEATTLSESVHSQEAAAATFGHLLDDYLVLSLAEQMLVQSVAAVEAKAGSSGVTRIAAAFARVTNGDYTIDGEEGPDGKTILVALERQWPNERKALSQLSEGTRDQLYLALRIVAIEDHAAAAPALPFLADDILQTFDDTRALAALRALLDLSQHTQVIVLTHHPHVAALAEALPPAASTAPPCNGITNACTRRGRTNTSAGTSATSVIAAMIHHPRRNAATCSTTDPGEPTTATSTATPIAIDACRIMFTAPDPVANDEAGSDAMLAPIVVGIVSPTPIPVGTMPSTASVKFGSIPGTTAHQTMPQAKHSTPALITGATPNRAINCRENPNDTIGTSSGPGAIASPIFSADQPQTLSSHSTIDSKIAPNAAENGASTSTAPVNTRTRNNAGSTNGLDDHKHCATNPARHSTAAPAVSPMPSECQPQSFTFTIANVRSPTPAVTSKAAPKFGRFTSCPGIAGSFHHPTINASTPIGTFTRKIQRQLAVTSRPPTNGPSAAATPPTAVQVRTAAPRLSGANDASSNPNDVGVINAAAAACTTRNTTSISTLLASAQAADAAVNAAIPARKLTLRAYRSDNRPKNTSSAA